MQTSTSTSYMSSPFIERDQQPVHVTVINESLPVGFFAAILRNVKDWSVAARVVAVALPAILTLGVYVLSEIYLPDDHLFRIIKCTIALVLPVVGTYEVTSLVREVNKQLQT